MIPKIIHQIWIGDQSKRPQKLLDSIRNMNPDWKYCLWTEQDLPRMVLRKQIDAIPDSAPAAKADLIRYELLYRYGGFYVDADSLALNPFDDFLLDNDSFAVWESEYFIPGWIANGYLGATQGNILMRTLVEKFKHMDPNELANMDPKNAAMTTGPRILTDLVKSMQYTDMMIYPSHYFIPEHYTGLIQPVRSPTYTKQMFGSTLASPFNYGE